MTGQITFSTTDPYNQYPGEGEQIVIEVEVQKLLGQQISQFFMLLRVTDPCLAFNYSPPDVDPFPAAPVKHALIEEPDYQISWNINTIAKRDVTQYCGPNKVEFLMHGTNTAIDSTLFTDTRNVDGNNFFVVNRGTDVLGVGTYKMFYRVTIEPKKPDLVRYNQQLDSEPFTIELYDKCAAKEVTLSSDPSFPTAIEYIISD